MRCARSGRPVTSRVGRRRRVVPVWIRYPRRCRQDLIRQRPKRLVLERAFPGFNELASEVFFGGEGIVCCAAQREIRRAVIAALGKWFQVMKLETMGLGAT